MKYYYFSLFLSLLLFYIITPTVEAYSVIRSERVKRGDPECVQNCRAIGKSRGACVWRTYMLNINPQLMVDYFEGIPNVCPDYYLCLCLDHKRL